MKKKFFWTDGGQIVGKRLQTAFLEGKLASRRVSSQGNRYWRAWCEFPGCKKTYDFTNKRLQGAKKGFCRSHSTRLGAGTPGTKDAWILEREPRLVFVPRKSQPGKKQRINIFVRCINEACDRLIDAYAHRDVCGKCLRPAYGKKRTNYAAPRKLRPFESTFNAFLAAQKNRNKTRKTPIDVALTYDQFVHICYTQPNCNYCGRDVGRTEYVQKWKPGTKDPLYMRTAYLDRLDPTKGYSIDNVVTACGPCNMTRNVWVSLPEMRLLAAARKGDIEEARQLLDQHAADFKQWGEEVKHMSLFGGKIRKDPSLLSISWSVEALPATNDRDSCPENRGTRFVGMPLQEPSACVHRDPSGRCMLLLRSFARACVVFA